MKKRNSLFLFSFIISTIIHVPIYSGIGSYYFGGEENYFKRLNKKVPFFTYYPRLREVKITPVKSLNKEKAQINNLHNVPSKDITSADNKKNREADASSFNNDKKRLPTNLKIPYKEPAPKVLLPMVEDIDLGDKVIYDAFYNYYELLSNIIGRFAVYPLQARKEKEEGIAYISFMLRKNGHLGEIVLRKSSDNSLLDRAAISAVQNASPFPPLPIELNKNEIRLNVPISFEID